jgi:hypothetical protein
MISTAYYLRYETHLQVSRGSASPMPETKCREWAVRRGPITRPSSRGVRQRDVAIQGHRRRPTHLDCFVARSSQ